MEVKLYTEFGTKREFLKWIDKHLDEVDFDRDVIRIEYFEKVNNEEENL